MINKNEFSNDYKLAIRILEDILLEKKVCFVVNDLEEEKMVQEYLLGFNFKALNIDNISELNTLINKEIGVDYVKKLLSIIKTMERYKKEFKNIKAYLTKVRLDNYSLLDMYKYTCSAGSIKSYYDDIFAVLKEEDSFSSLELNEILSTTKKIADLDLINCYYKYERFKANDIFNSILTNPPVNEIEKVIHKIKGLLNNKYALLPPINLSQYGEEFISRNIYVKKYSDDELYEICKDINSTVNVNLEDIQYKFKWTDLLNFKKYKRNINRNRELKIKKAKNIENIFKEYKDNIENFDIYINSFSFMKKVFTEDYVKNIEIFIADSDEFERFLQQSVTKLTVYKDYIINNNKLMELSEVEKIILSTVYKSDVTKEEAVDFINMIPKQFIKTKIIDIHNENDSELEIDSYIKNIIRKLKSCMEAKKALMIKGELPIFIIKHFDGLDYYLNNEIAYYFYEDLLENSKSNFVDELQKGESCLVLEDNLNILKDLKQIIYSLKLNIVKENETGANIYKIYNKRDKENYIYLYISDGLNKVESELDTLLSLSYKNILVEYVWIRDYWLNKDGELNRIKKIIKEHFFIHK